VRTRDLWLREGVVVLTEEGPGGVRIDRLAARLGLTKGSFHHHFAGVADYHAALLAHVERTQVDPLDAMSAETPGIDPADVLRGLPARLAELYDADLDRALRAWAIEDGGARDLVERIDRARLAFLEALWSQVVTDDPARARAAALLPHLLLVGANSIRPPLDDADRQAVFGLLPDLIPHV
jgi:AcrR family transcriptional regulator